MKEIKLNDKMFQAIDPEYTNSFDYALEVTIIGITTEKSLNLDDEEVEKITHCEVDYGTFDDNCFVKAENLFQTKEEALESIKEEIKVKIEKLELKLSKYKEIISNIHEK